MKFSGGIKCKIALVPLFIMVFYVNLRINEKNRPNCNISRKKREKFVKIKKSAQIIDKHGGYVIVLFVFINR